MYQLYDIYYNYQQTYFMRVHEVRSETQQYRGSSFGVETLEKEFKQMMLPKEYIQQHSKILFGSLYYGYQW
jgi:hypothetical protein